MCVPESRVRGPRRLCMSPVWVDHPVHTHLPVRAGKPGWYPRAQRVVTPVPTWRFDAATFALTAPSFDNPDFVPVVIHSYRHRHGNAPSDPRFDAVERHLAGSPPITVPTIVLHGADDTVSSPGRSESQMSHFPATTARHVIPHAGHFMPREQSGAVVDALLSLLSATA